MNDREEYIAIVARELRSRCPLAERFEVTVGIPSGATYVAVSIPEDGEAVPLGKFPDRWLTYCAAGRKARKKVYGEVASVCQARAGRAANEDQESDS